MDLYCSYLKIGVNLFNCSWVFPICCQSFLGGSWCWWSSSRWLWSSLSSGCWVCTPETMVNGMTGCDLIKPAHPELVPEPRTVSRWARGWSQHLHTASASLWTYFASSSLRPQDWGGLLSWLAWYSFLSASKRSSFEVVRKLPIINSFVDWNQRRDETRTAALDSASAKDASPKMKVFNYYQNWK